MREVTREEFFRVINQLDVHPVPDVNTFKERYFKSVWKMQDSTRRVVGETVTDSHQGDPTVYKLAN
jgi:hypothetical protein